MGLAPEFARMFCAACGKEYIKGYEATYLSGMQHGDTADSVVYWILPPPGGAQQNMIS